MSSSFSSFWLSHIQHVRGGPRSSGLARKPFIIGLPLAGSMHSLFVRLDGMNELRAYALRVVFVEWDHADK